jgi:positive regulator of sigma E activity
MIQELGVVEKEETDSLTVRISAAGECNECAIREACSAMNQSVRVPKTPGFSVNDPVRLTMHHTSVLGITALLYGLPLLATLAGLLGLYFGLPAGVAEDTRILSSSLGALVGLLGAGFFVSRFDSRLKKRIRYTLEPAS